MEIFEKLVKEKINDEEKAKCVINFFYEKFNEKEDTLIYRFNEIAKFEDILTEFTECIVKNTYDLWDPIFVGVYNAKLISKLNNNFNAYDVYSFLSDLKAGNEISKTILEGHIALKLNEADENE